MNILLKKAIVDWMFENRDEYQLVNATTNHFKAYIYADNGHYLFGGQDVAVFIDEVAKLIAL